MGSILVYMNINIYTDNGYINMAAILDAGFTFNFLVGGRGTGKTYGALLEALKQDKRFILMRRTQTQMELISTEEYSPFKKINSDIGSSIEIRSIRSKYSAGIFRNEELIGYTMALSTIANMRGFDASDCSLLIYDEFIPEKHERNIKNEADALFNAYETINRNRELEGQDPVKLLCLANSNRADNPIFMNLGLITIMERMKKTGQEIYADRERSILIINFENSIISQKKSKTALYKLTKGSDFEKMSIGNSFAFDDFSCIGSRNLNEYKPLVSIGEITIYRHKSKKDYYVTEHRSGSPDHYGVTERELTSYRQHYWRLWDYYIDGYMTFESYLTKSLFTSYTYG